MERIRLQRSYISGKIIILIGVFLLINGCATKIPITMLQPAEYHEASLTKTVAVLPFSGQGGQQITSEVEGVLGSINIDGKNYFTLVDRNALDKIMKEMKLGQSGMVDANTAAEVGKLIGAQGIYTGAVTQNNSTEGPYTEPRQECTQYAQKCDAKGNCSQGNCLNWRNYNVNCVKRSGYFAFTPKLIEVQTGKIIYTRDINGSATSNGCSDGTPAKSGSELIGQSIAMAKVGFRNDIAPRYITREVKLMDSTDGISSSAAKDKLKLGIDYAGKKRMDAACELWGEADTIASNSASITYNLGVCAESRGDMAAALPLYKKADKLLGKPNDDITLALVRVTEAIKNQEKLKAQLKNK
jgi:tetratricopeptide (TPR) repeat protein